MEKMDRTQQVHAEHEEKPADTGEHEMNIKGSQQGVEQHKENPPREHGSHRKNIEGINKTLEEHKNNSQRKYRENQADGGRTKRKPTEKNMGRICRTWGEPTSYRQNIEGTRKTLE